MERSCVKNLLDNLSKFSLLSLEGNIGTHFIQRSLQDIEDTLKCLTPILEIFNTHDFVGDEEIILLFEELNSIIAKSIELAESWHQTTSKVYFDVQKIENPLQALQFLSVALTSLGRVLEFESVITKLHTNLIETCAAISTLFQSIGMKSNVQHVEQCAQKVQCITIHQTSAIIRDAIRDQIKSGLPSAEFISKIGDLLSLSTNWELLMEIVALDKLKSEIDHGDNLAEVEYIDHMIALVSHLQDCYVDKHQVHSINNIAVPADFCCPLSLQLMSDPVIVASGQTYERAYIRKWLDQGFTVCPKTRQTLVHTNLIPNYTVKALIGNWCETNDVKLPEPSKMLSLIDHEREAMSYDLRKTLHPRSPESNRVLITSGRNSHFGNGFPQEANAMASSTPHALLTGSSLWDGTATNSAKLALCTIEAESSTSEKRDADSFGQSSKQLDSSLLADGESKYENGSASELSTVGDSGPIQGVEAKTSSSLTSNASYINNDASSESTQEPPTSIVPSQAPEFLPRLSELRPRNQAIWRRASDRFSPRIIASSMDMRPDLAGIETQVRKLIEDLKSESIDEQRNAATELRLLARHSVQNRVVIATCGAITHLVSLLHSSDQKVQENAVTALLNLSIDDNNKVTIANADAIDPLIHVLKTGNSEAKENTAATLFSLSVIDQNKANIGRSGAIVPLVDLLGNGTPRGKRDAATALFNLSTFHENKARIVQAGAVKHLVDLMDPAAGMVDKAVAVLSNLSTIPEGRSSIGRENGIPFLVEVVELGSARGKENAAAALLQLCTNSSRFCNMVLQEGAVPPLVALTQTGTARAKEKAQSLLSYFRNQRHGNSRRT